MKKLILVVCLCSFSSKLAAQQAETGVEGLRFVAPMQIAVGADNNFLVDRVQPGTPDVHTQRLDDKVLMLTLPKVAYQNDSRRRQFVLSWVPEFELFKNNSDQNAMNHEALASFSYHLRRNVQIWLADNYKTSKDPARALSNVFLLLPRSRYHENEIHAALEFQPTPLTNVAIRYDGGYTKFGRPEPIHGQILDSRSSGYSLSLSRMLRPNQRIRATYSLFTITPIHQPNRSDDALDIPPRIEHPINSGTLEYRFGLNPSTVLEFAGGIIKLDTGMNYTVRGSFHKRIGLFWAAGGYMRTLAFQAGPPNAFAHGLGSNGFYDVILMRLRGQPTRRTAILFDTTISRDASNRVVEGNKSLMGRARFDYRLSDRNVLFASLDSFHQGRNDYVRAPLSRNRFMMGIEISLSSESERRSNRLNEDAQYVALTDHERRRRSLEED